MADNANEMIGASPRADTLEDDELDEEQMIAEASNLMRPNGGGKG